jgi:hypothetical protein
MDWNQLPGSVLGLVFGFLSVFDVIGCCHRVSRSWKQTRAAWTSLDLSPANNDPVVAHAILRATLCRQVSALQIEATLAEQVGSELSNLKSLRLDTNHYREENAKPNCSELARCFPRLEMLDLGNYFVQHSLELKALGSSVPLLRELDLTNIFFDRDMIDFNQFQCLEALTLDIGLSDVDLEMLCTLRLRKLDIAGYDITDAGLIQVGSMKTLEVFRLAKSPHITNTGLQNLQNLPGLRALRFGADQLTDEGLRHLAKFHASLRDLDLSFCKITGTGFDEQFGAAKFMELESLNLRYCSKLQSIGTLRHAPKLESLDLQGCGLLARDQVLLLVDDAAKLKRLNLSECWSLSKADLASLTNRGWLL